MAYVVLRGGTCLIFASAFVIILISVIVVRTCVNVVRCRLRAGVGHAAADGLWPMCWPPQALEPPPPPPVSDELSVLSFLNEPSEPRREQ